MSGLRFALPAAALCVSLALTAEALADSISINQNVIIDRSYTRSQDTEPTQLSLRDCQENAVVNYSVNITAPRVRSMEIWIGKEECTTAELRRECELLASPMLGGGSRTISLAAQDIIGEDCVGEQSGGDPITLKLYFAFLGSNGEPNQDESAIQPITYDVVASDPPTLEKLGEGDGQLQANWTPLDAADVTGYRFYCESSQSAGTTTGASTTGSAGAAGATGNNPDCPSASLVQGQVPDESLFCGSAGPTSSRGTAKGLTNYQAYAVGMTTRDAVGNVGPLSNILCQTPVEVVDYYEAYTDAGGDGGGGFCSLSPRRGTGPWSLLALAAALAGLSRRRRAHS